MNKDHEAWFAYIATGFTGVDQTGNTFSLTKPESGKKDADPSKVLSEQFDIRKMSVSGEAALVLVHHREHLHLIGRELNGRDLGAKPDHDVRVDEVMRQIWVKVGQQWKLKHWDDLSGKIWVDGRLQESWAPDRLTKPPPRAGGR